MVLRFMNMPGLSKHSMEEDDAPVQPLLGSPFDTQREDIHRHHPPPFLLTSRPITILVGSTPHGNRVSVSVTPTRVDVELG